MVRQCSDGASCQVRLPASLRRKMLVDPCKRDGKQDGKEPPTNVDGNENRVSREDHLGLSQEVYFEDKHYQ